MDSPSDMTHWCSLTAMTVFMPTALTLGRFPEHLYASVHYSTCGMFLKWEILSHQCLPDKSAAAAKCCCVCADNNLSQTSPRKEVVQSELRCWCCWRKDPLHPHTPSSPLDVLSVFWQTSQSSCITGALQQNRALQIFPFIFILKNFDTNNLWPNLASYAQICHANLE